MESATQWTAKATTQRVLDNLPDDCTIEDIIRELAFHKMIEEGLADLDAGRTISHEEMKARIESWRK